VAGRHTSEIARLCGGVDHSFSDGGEGAKHDLIRLSEKKWLKSERIVHRGIQNSIQRMIWKRGAWKLLKRGKTAFWKMLNEPTRPIPLTQTDRREGSTRPREGALDGIDPG